ncbi:hypothetical protein BBO_00052 [Beauveria brongniartii RCEF 3172]|uniref:Uncharacterized protein n=1 Tax=Beauveria brongniartii RCEF 3172 TaxID=1081107 RepID=A0A167KUF2_9HYPO|nr:hypothetical protein BBO_00052 [Beauveria brongniartii RCEF 3172]
MGGSMPLPRISGFSKAFFSDNKLSPDVEHIMSDILGNNRFQKGSRAARSYANLVVLFRMMLFYAPLMHDARFWKWVTEDWGIVKGDMRDTVSRIANFYSDARYAAFASAEQRISLLVRLVTEWLLIRPRPEIRHSAEVDEATVAATRTAWLKIRDWHVDMLMDGKLPPCLAGVEPPEKKVTSLWETDPEVVALLKEIQPTRKSKTLVHKAGTPKMPGVQTQPASPSVDRPSMKRKRKSSSFAGESDEGESMLASGKSFFDECRFTLRSEPEQGELAFSMPGDRVPKRNHLSENGDSSEHHFAPETVDAFDMIDFTDAGDASLPVPPPSSKPARAFIQSKLTQYTDRHAAAATASPDQLQQEQNVQLQRIMSQRRRRREDLNVQLRRMASQTRRQREELRAQVETETAACVPLPPALGVESGLMASEERQLYEARLRGVEARLAALERAQRDDANWARATGQSLHEANDRSVQALQKVLVAVETLQRTTSILLEDEEEREE